MDFSQENYYLIAKALDDRGISFKDIATSVGVNRNHVWITLKRYCGAPRPKGPQSAIVEKILNAVAQRLEESSSYPSEPVGTNGASLLRERPPPYTTDIC
jgi:Homeodomain-like domain